MRTQRRRSNVFRNPRRLLRVETLERRRLLASDFGGYRTAASTDGLWAELSVREPIMLGPADPHISAPSSTPQSYLRATNFKTYAIDAEQFASQFDHAEAAISIPTPDGGFESFLIEPSSVMSPELAEKFPGIQTYSGVGVDSNASLRLDISPAGVHAQVFTEAGHYYVDPYFHLEDQFYASYYGRGQSQDLHFVEELIAANELDHDHEVSASAASSGSELRTYRAAFAASAEYTAFHGGTVELGQAAIVTAINRINGVYESELSIRLELVPNNDQLVYTNAQSDPYTNTVSSAQLSANHANLNSVIGNDAYDIGHVLVTAGGGIASLGVVGIDALKGRGTTGADAPIGDFFFVDLLAHEIGHQFGAGHTFNGDSGSCAGGNRAGGTAFEPGSGSTIMAYAGICGDDDIQFASDAHFHFASLDQIIEHVDIVIPDVGTRTATGNSVPTVNGGLDYVIPARTPFALTAQGNDADQDDVLTYAWEQADLGPQQDVAAGDNGSSPIFRSFQPTTNPTRTFPNLQDLRSGETTVGETLPTTTRDLNFRVTVRDSRPGGSAVAGDDVLIEVVDTGDAFEVLSPNGGESFDSVSVQTVTWEVAGTTGNGIDTPNVDILLSIDDGVNFPIILADGVPNDGMHDVIIPDLDAERARIKIVGSENVFFDISDDSFAIGTARPVTCSAYEHFDGVDVNAPDLPSGWVTSVSGDGVEWILVDSGSDTAPNHAFVPNPNGVGDSFLVSPSLTGPNVIVFDHYYQTEADYDGGVLEISVAGGPFQDILQAGGGFTSGGYNQTLSDGFGNPLGGREAWSGDSQGYIETSVSLPPSAVGQDIQLRWRLGSDNGFDAPGWRIDSIQTCLVEDLGFDFGDAPDPSFPTLDASDGAVHRIGGNLYLGSNVDQEVDGQPSVDSRGDDLLDGNDDEDGVVLPTTITPGESASINVNASIGNGLLNAWFDFNGDGDWDDPNEQVFVDLPLSAGDNDDLALVVPSDATPGLSYARFRLSTQAGLSHDGFAIDGEVEDYQINIAGASSISGVKYHDLDGDGFRDVGEPGLPGFTIFLDENENGVLDSDEASVLTDAEGLYAFDDLTPGAYHVVELGRPGWSPTFLAKSPVVISSGEPTDLAIADFDSDQNLDALVVVPELGQVVRLRGSGDGTFTVVETAVPVGANPTAIAVGDFDASNGVDFATVDFNNDALSVWLNEGAGSFVEADGATFSVGSSPNLIAAGNLANDDDADTDLFVALTGRNEWATLANDGAGLFTSSQVTDSSQVDFATDAVVANLDDDPRPDVVLSYANTGNVEIILNPATGAVSNVQQLEAGEAPMAVASADFNSDGYSDIVTANRDTDDVSVLFNLGDGSGAFAAAIEYPAGSEPSDVSVGDFNRDGLPDIAVANPATDSLALLFNRGDGTFALPLAFDVGVGPAKIESQDVNGDGFDDLVAVNRTAKTLSVLVNSSRQEVTLGAGQDVVANIGNRLYEAVAPEVERLTINGGDDQRSYVDRVSLTFNTTISIDDTGGSAFRVTNLATNEPVDLLPVVSQAFGKTVVDLVFLPGDSLDQTGTLVDADYRLTVDADRISSDGLALDGDGDGATGDSYIASAVDGFFRKFGDHDGDNFISLLDFAAFRSTYSKEIGDDGFLTHLDVDLDSQIGLLDFAAFRRNYGR